MYILLQCGIVFVVYINVRRVGMETRKKGCFSDAAGNLRKELDQVDVLEEEQGFAEENITFTRACDTVLSIICC